MVARQNFLAHQFRRYPKYLTVTRRTATGVENLHAPEQAHRASIEPHFFALIGDAASPSNIKAHQESGLRQVSSHPPAYYTCDVPPPYSSSLLAGYCLQPCER